MPWEESALGPAIAAGNAEAEEALVVRFRPRVRRMVEAALRRGPDRDDLACEILEAVVASLRRGSFRGDCQLGTFIHAVARNKIAEYIRRARPETTELDEGIPDRAPFPDDAVIQEEMGRAIREALEDLKPKYRVVLYLYYFRGMTVGEIGAALGLPPRRVSERKDYGLKVMRARFGRSLLPFR
jgi:RNA polymerase sigma factor (sigma-70 family)